MSRYLQPPPSPDFTLTALSPLTANSSAVDSISPPSSGVNTVSNRSPSPHPRTPASISKSEPGSHDPYPITTNSIDGFSEDIAKPAKDAGHTAADGVRMNATVTMYAEEIMKCEVPLKPCSPAQVLGWMYERNYVM